MSDTEATPNPEPPAAPPPELEPNGRGEDAFADAPMPAAEAPPAVADAPSTAAEAEEQASETARIQRLADIWGTLPVLSRQNLRTFAVVQEEFLREWMMRETDDTLCIMDDGVVITAYPDSPQVEAACTLLSMHSKTPVVRPAMLEVVRSARRLAVGEEQQIGDSLVQVEDRTETDVSRMLTSILDTAISRNVSDIHFEMRGDRSIIRFRVDGQLVVHDQITARETMALGNFMFNSEAKRGTLQFITYQPLHGSMDAEVRGQKVAIRLSTAPDIRGVDIFMRIWRPDAAALKLDDLGYTPLHIDMVQEAISHPYGAIVISGPTGSGKSTTLTAVLEVVDPSLKVVSLEEPVERMLPNVTHVAISAIAEHGGWENLRSGLNRWDSNINMLGEIKDRETAKAIVDLTTSGKLTMTTLHASNALAIPARMEDLGVGHTMLYDPNFLVMLMNQRLLPRLCTECRVPYAQAEDLDPLTRQRYDEAFGDRADQVYVRGPGCAACAGSGISGRLLAAEIVMMDNAARHFIREYDSMGWRKHLEEQGWRPIMDHALQHMYSGIADPRAIERTAGRLGTDDAGNFDYAARERLFEQVAAP